MKFDVLFFGMAAVMLGSCCKSNDPQPEPDFLVFGIDFAECAGDCATLYKISGEKVYADENVDYIFDAVNQEFTFENTALGQEKYETAKILVDEFPTQLWNEPEGWIGMPNAHDQGGLTVRKKQGRTVKTWYIDVVEERLPEYLRDYANKTRQVIDSL